MPNKNALSAEVKAYVESVAVNGAQIRCTDPDLSKLTADELNLLHLCKHEICASIHRLYVKVGPRKADPILRKYLQTVVDDTTPKPNPGQQ
ncbi:MAG: hypothetical protein ABL871_06910 [Terricaulis sp.]